MKALALGLLFPMTLLGQAGSVTGHVTDEISKPVSGATVRLVGAPYATRARDDGAFRIDYVPSGSYQLRVTLIGFNPDTETITVRAGAATDVTVRLRAAAVNLPAVLVTAYRMGESKAVALDKQRDADNIVSVLSGDEIRALPNANAAEAAGRIPGVSLERDEGEGKFVQVRGTEPRLQNVTVDGSHVPGTEAGDRIVKLDDVPAEILSAIEVSKTLTADMDADAIGGSVNLVTKVPEGAPRGYISGQFGHITLLDHTTGQGGLTWGGRFGQDQKLGFLIGGSVDRFNRVINDIEPAWTVDGSGQSIPVEWSERDYGYFRNRYGLGGDLDYRFSDHSKLYVKGMWSLFENYGNRWVNDVAGVPGPAGTDTAVSVTREVQLRTPKEQLWGVNAGGRQDNEQWALDYALNLAGTRQSVTDYRTSPFTYIGPAASIQYDASNITMPMYHYSTPTEATAAATASNYALSGYDATNGLTTGSDIGGQINLQRTYALGNQLGAFKMGLRYRDESKDYVNRSTQFAATGTFLLSQALSSFSDPNYYSYLAPFGSFPLGPLPDYGTAHAYENANPGAFTSQTDTVGNALSSFSGKERIFAGYVMNAMDLSASVHLNIGLRVEMTHSSYLGHVATSDTAGNTTGLSTVTGTHDYTDLFPSAQLRYEVDENTNVRLAVTRAIARPNYSDLAPSLQGTLDPILQHQYGNLSAGNPDLKPQHSWNFDFLVEKYLPAAGGVISGGVFYKRISDFIAQKDFIYNGPYAPFDGYYGTEPENGGDGHLVGIEADWTQHLTFLPGVFSGLGFDVNWTHVSSSVVVDTATGRTAPMLRTSPDVANAALTYDKSFVSARVAWTYNGANITAYGDGTPTANGDNYFYAHSQIDASAIFTVTPAVQVQVQVLNINNAVFGFFNGTPGHAYDVQREYYGQTFYLGLKYGF